MEQPLRILCTREYQNSIADSVHKLLRITIDRLGVRSWFHITQNAITSKAGGEFIFKGLAHNISEVKSTESVDVAWVEEGQNTSKESWRTLIPTIRKEGSEIWCSFNITDELAETHQRFLINPPPGAIVKLVNYDTNPYLSTESKDEIEYLKTVDFQAFEHVYLGLPVKISDSIIFGGRYKVEAFSDTLWKKADRLLFGADWGFAQDPSTLIRMFILDAVLYIEYEAYGVGVEFAGNMVDGRGELEQLWHSVPEASKHWPIKADSARPETISFMRGKTFNVSAADKWDGCVEDGISYIKGFQQIIIHERCKRTQEEARLYSYKRDKISGDVLPIIVDKHNHCWDAIRYALGDYIKTGHSLAVWAKLGQQ